MPPISRDTNTLFNKIIAGNAESSDYTMSNYQSLFEKIAHSWSMRFVGDVASLNSTQKLNLIAYVRNSFANNSGTNTLQPALLKATIQLFHSLFTNIKGWDENAVRETKALTDLFDKVLANNIHFVNSQHNLLYDLTINAQQFGTHLGNIIKNIPDPLRSNYPSDDLLAPFLHAIKSLAAQPAYGKGSYSELITLLTQVRRDCLSIQSCNHKLSLSEFFAILGVLYKENNDGSDRSKPAVSLIQDHAIALMETVKNSHFAQSDDLNSNEVKELALRFSQQAFSDHNSDTILRAC